MNGPELEDMEPPAPEKTALTLRNPAVPVTIEQLAAVPGQTLDITEARVQVVKTLRHHSLSITHEIDWVLFKGKEEDISKAYGYLQDAGCDRIRDLWGVSIFNVSKPEKIAGSDGSFIYIITGDGRCAVTGQIVEGIEGGRSSTDDICRGVTGAELELLVRKSARANLDGNITRELTGTKSMPVSELTRAWQGTGKSVENCRQGRGFGAKHERLGVSTEKEPAHILPPNCSVCGATGVYRPATDKYEAFYGCPKYASHKDRKWAVKVADWVKQQETKEVGQ